jgi:threonylcarbamoyladenosine tRNA methylthiotransferase MtaB
MTAEYMKRHIGRTEKVLIEEQQVIFGKKYMIGHTPDYIMTAVSDPSLSPGDAVGLKLTGILTEEIMSAER